MGARQRVLLIVRGDMSPHERTIELRKTRARLEQRRREGGRVILFRVSTRPTHWVMPQDARYSTL
jgi:hypothetical protein